MNGGGGSIERTATLRGLRDLRGFRG